MQTRGEIIKILLFLSFLFFNQQKLFSQKVSDSVRLENLFDSITQNLYVKTDPVLAWSDEAIQLAEGLNNQSYLAKIYSYKACTYDLKGNFNDATVHFLKAIDIQEELRDEKGLSFSYSNLGICYHNQFKYLDAIEFLEKSIAIDSKYGKWEDIAGTKINMGIAYSYLCLLYTSDAADD